MVRVLVGRMTYILRNPNILERNPNCFSHREASFTSYKEIKITLANWKSYLEETR